MRILLANMPINFNKKENLEPPLGISYIGAVLKKEGHQVFLKDYEVENFSEEEVIDFIIKNEIRLVGVSFRTASYKSAKIFIKALGRVRDKILIVTGGHHVTAFPGQTISDLSCDIAVRGEGEYALKELAKVIEEGRPFSSVKGITYRLDGRIVENEERGPILNLDELPFPARELLHGEMYTVATILTSRGCPFSCIYCDKGISTRQVKFRSPENVFSEISNITKDYPGRRIYFVDDHFFLHKERLVKIFDLCEKNGLRFSWLCQGRVDGVDLDILKRAKAAGCNLIMYGIESGDPEELKYMGKQATPEDARKALVLTKKAGINARANFMIGFPMSTHKTVRNTIRFAGSVPLEVVRFFSVAPLPNTELWDRVYGADIDLNSVDWSKFDFYTPTYSTVELSPQEILEYVAVAYIYVLKKKVLMEAFVTFLPRFTKFLYLVFKKKKIRGNISKTFPSSVNLLLDLNAVMRSRNLYKKIRFLTKAFYLEHKL